MTTGPRDSAKKRRATGGRRWVVLSVLALVLAAASMLSAVATGNSGSRAKPSPKAPKRVLIVLFDGMRPEMADRFDMPNFRSLRGDGVNFSNAYVGHLIATTVIAHEAIVTGLEPRHMGWTDEMHRDVRNVLGGGANALWTPGVLTPEQFGLLEKDAGHPKLGDYLRAGNPGSKFITVGYKTYASDSVGGNGGSDDIAVRMSNPRTSNNAECTIAGGAKWRKPAGVNVPEYLTDVNVPYYLTDFACGRFYVMSDRNVDYGTKTTSPAWTNQLDGNRSVPGNDPAHLGGDTWVADAAIKMTGRENWNGMFVTLGGMDNASHMWGPDDSTSLPADDPNRQARLSFLAKNADEQLGKLLAELRRLDLLDDTLVVLTADHGFESASRAWYGLDAFDQGWVGTGYGQTMNDGLYPSEKLLPGLKPLFDAGNMQGISGGRLLTEYLVDRTPAKIREAAILTRAVPGVIATYYRDGARYRLDTDRTATPMTRDEQKWLDRHGQELVNTMAADYGPDVIGLQGDRIGYGAYGDHGGANEADQRIPMVFWSPSIDGKQKNDEFRQHDILPTVLDALGEAPAKGIDGRAKKLANRAGLDLTGKPRWFHLQSRTGR